MFGRLGLCGPIYYLCGRALPVIGCTYVYAYNLALSHHPEVNEEVEKEATLESDKDEWIMVSYQVEDQGGRISSTKFNQAISELVGGTKIDKKLKDRIHVMDIAKEKLDGETIEVATGMVSLFDCIPSKEMAEYQHQDNQISSIIK